MAYKFNNKTVGYFFSKRILLAVDGNNNNHLQEDSGKIYNISIYTFSFIHLFILFIDSLGMDMKLLLLFEKSPGIVSSELIAIMPRLMEYDGTV